VIASLVALATLAAFLSWCSDAMGAIKWP